LRTGTTRVCTWKNSRSRLISHSSRHMEQ